MLPVRSRYAHGAVEVRSLVVPGATMQCCRVLSQYHLNIHSNSDTRDVHVQSMYMGLPYTHIHHMTDYVTE